MLRELAKKWLQGWVELLLAFPILLYIAVSFVPDSRFWLWWLLLPLSYLAGILLGSFLGIRRRGLQIAIGVAAGGALSFLLFGIGVAFVLGGIVAAVAIVRGFLFTEAAWPVWFRSIYFLPALVVYFIVYLLFSNNAPLVPYLTALTWAGLAAIAVTIWIVNARNLSAQSLSGKKRHRIAPSVVRQNRVMIGATVVLIGLLGGLGLIRQFADWLYASFRSFIALILSLLDREYEELEETPPDLVSPEDGEFVGRTPSELGPLLERYALYFVIGLLVVGAIVALFLFGKHFKKIWERLRQWRFTYRKHARNDSDDFGYVDEKARSITWKQWRDAYGDRLKGWLARLLEREPRWEQLQDNTERVRYIYRHYLLRRIASGYLFKRFLTPAETAADIRKWDASQEGAEQLIEFYNQARYGQGRLEQNDVEQLYRRTK